MTSAEALSNRRSNVANWPKLVQAAQKYFDQTAETVGGNTRVRGTQYYLLAAMAAHLGVTEAEDFAQGFQAALHDNQIFNVLEVGPNGFPLSFFIPDYQGLKLHAIDQYKKENLFPEVFRYQVSPHTETALSRLDFRPGDVANLEEVFPGIKFDLIFLRGVFSASQTPSGMRLTDTVRFFNQRLEVIVRALSQHPMAALFAVPYGSYLMVQPSKLVGVDTFLWEDYVTSDLSSRMAIDNWQLLFGENTSPGALAAFRKA